MHAIDVIAYRTCNGQEPSFRVYDVNATTGDLIDFYHYRPDLLGQGLVHNLNPASGPPVWKLAYRASEAYNLPDLSAASWLNVAQSLISNDTAFNFYLENYSPDFTFPPVSNATRIGYICEIIGATPAAYTACMNYYQS